MLSSIPFWNHCSHPNTLDTRLLQYENSEDAAQAIFGFLMLCCGGV